MSTLSEASDLILAAILKRFELEAGDTEIELTDLTQGMSGLHMVTWARFSYQASMNPFPKHGAVALHTWSSHVTPPQFWWFDFKI